MTDIKEKALALVNEVRVERGWEPLPILYRTNYEAEALCRALEQHEAFKQEVSDSWHTMETAPKDGSEIDVWVYINHTDAAPWEGRITACWWGCVDDFGPCWNSGNEPLPFLCKTNFLRWRHPPKPPLIIPKPKPDPLADALLELADAEKNYRWLHDTQGGGHIDTGRAWDKMRRAGDKARAALEARGFEIREKGQ